MTIVPRSVTPPRYYKISYTKGMSETPASAGAQHKITRHYYSPPDPERQPRLPPQMSAVLVDARNNPDRKSLFSQEKFTDTGSVSAIQRLRELGKLKEKSYIKTERDAARPIIAKRQISGRYHD